MALCCGAGLLAPSVLAAQAVPRVAADGGAASDTGTVTYETGGIRVIQRQTAGDIAVANLYLLGGTRQVTWANAGIEPFFLEATERGTRSYPKDRLRRLMSRLGTGIQKTNDSFSTRFDEFIGLSFGQDTRFRFNLRRFARAGFCCIGCFFRRGLRGELRFVPCFVRRFVPGNGLSTRFFGFVCGSLVCGGFVCGGFFSSLFFGSRFFLGLPLFCRFVEQRFDLRSLVIALLRTCRLLRRYAFRSIRVGSRGFVRVGAGGKRHENEGQTCASSETTSDERGR